MFFYFQPDPWVEIQFSPLALVDGFIFEIMIQFDSSICFEMGWNHHLVADSSRFYLFVKEKSYLLKWIEDFGPDIIDQL